MTRIDCQFHRPPDIGERANYVALNPARRPGSLVYAASYAAREGLSSHVAAKLSLEHFTAAVLDYYAGLAPNAPGSKTQAISLEVLESAFRNANTSVYNFGHKLAAGGRMAACLLGIVIDRHIVAAGRVGASSAYLFRAGELFPFFEARSFSGDEAASEKLIGAHSIVSVELASVPVQENDCVLAFSTILDSDTELQLSTILSEDPLRPGQAPADYYMRRILTRLFADPAELLFAMCARIGPEAIYLGSDLLAE